MNKYLFTLATTFVSLLFSVLFSGCTKDTCKHTHTYTWYEPLYKTSAEVRANIKSNPPTAIKAPGKIVIIGKYIFLNEVDKGIHVIDNTHPSSPVNIAFIDIPGNIDIAVKGNTLYADLYTDLVTLDIANPLNVTKTKIIDGVFPNRSYNYGFVADGSKIIFDWARHDTTLTEDCGQPLWNSQQLWDGRGGVLYSADASGLKNSSGSPAPIGISGSMARFALVNNYLYTVDQSYLKAFDITNSNNPTFSNKVGVEWSVETIYPFKNKLFIGSNNGMFIYDVESSPEYPAKLGEFTHVRACDPVIADDSFALVTLHSGTDCMGFNNQLDVVKLNNLTNSELVKTYSMTSPHGLSKDGNLLFICDGTEGLKVFDASYVMNLQLIKQININNLETYDVIASGNIALVVAVDGLYEYDYSNVNDIRLLSKLNIIKQ